MDERVEQPGGNGRAGMLFDSIENLTLPLSLSLRPPLAVERTSPTELHTLDIVSVGVLKAAFQGGLQQ
jgi:hypothetical protein